MYYVAEDDADEETDVIGVTGACGTIGSELVRRLSDDGEAVRAFTRRPDEQSVMDGVEWVEADLSDRDTLPAAFDGCRRLFLLTGNTEDMVRLQKNVIRAARSCRRIIRAGYRMIVGTAGYGSSRRETGGPSSSLHTTAR